MNTQNPFFRSRHSGSTLTRVQCTCCASFVGAASDPRVLDIIEAAHAACCAQLRSELTIKAEADRQMRDTLDQQGQLFAA